MTDLIVVPKKDIFFLFLGIDLICGGRGDPFLVVYDQDLDVGSLVVFQSTKMTDSHPDLCVNFS